MRKKKPLFPQVGGLLHGGDYNPEQWMDRPDILAKDMEMMKKAGINTVTLGVFSWSVYEPEEGVYHFDWLEERMDRLYENGIYTVLATPSGARPAWLDEAYPEAMRVDEYGVRNHHGVRHNHCMTSPKYREKVANIDRRLAERVGKHPGLIMWHISNEFGGECYCPLCVNKFQKYLAEKYHHDIGELNHAWWNTFWSHNYSRFDQIEPPFCNGEVSNLTLKLEWQRFTSWNTADFMKEEIKLVKEITPEIPATTNFMQLYPGLDYRVLAKKLDVVSWDSYPDLHNDRESFYDSMARCAFDHGVMRGMKPDRPFMLMESAPGLVNWQPYNKVKRPGIHKLFSLQAVACGSDTVQYFQWRKGRGSAEQFHGAVVDHLGTDDTRIFKEVAALGKDLQKLKNLAGTVVRARTALMFDWDNMWAIQNMQGLSNETKRYEETCVKIYREFVRLGVDMDVIPSDYDLSAYDVVVAPMLYQLRPGVSESLKSFVARGGQLLATYFTGYVDEHLLCHLGGFPGDGLHELFGVISEEIDTLYPSDRNAAVFTDGSMAEIVDYAEVLRVKDAEVLAVYESDFYQGSPVVTAKKTGKGTAYYVAARIEYGKLGQIFQQMLDAAGVPVKELPEGVEYHCREMARCQEGEASSGAEATADDFLTGTGERYEFYLNHTSEEKEISGVSGTELLTGEKIEGTVTISGYDIAVVMVQG